MEQIAQENEMRGERGKKRGSAELECISTPVINFDYSCVMHAARILVAE